MQREVIRVVIFLLKLYQWVVSPLYVFIGGSVQVCRFKPSCSEYALQAISLHGIRRGIFLTCKRLLHCHPFSNKPVEDEVPQES